MRAVLRRLRGHRPAPLRVTAPPGMLDLLRDGPLPLAPGGAERADAQGLDVAIVVPEFRRGSGGHSTIANLVRGLEARGHSCSLWLVDTPGLHAGMPPGEVERLFGEFFGPVVAPLHTSFTAWGGADVAVATGWQTVPTVARLPGARARAYLVQDHEPEFYATSAERTWAEQTYRVGLHAITAGRWLAELVRERYGAAATPFELAVDPMLYRPERPAGAARSGQGRPTGSRRDELPARREESASHASAAAQSDVARRDDLVVFYARVATPRRAVPLGALALEELHRRRPQLRLATFGDPRPVECAAPLEHLGVLDHPALARLYREATVGIVLSMTNPSLIPGEMLACGLPCVELDTPGNRLAYGDDGPVALAPFDPLALADAVEALLDDPQERDRRAETGAELVAPRTWAAAAEGVEAGLRAALRGQQL